MEPEGDAFFACLNEAEWALKSRVNGDEAAPIPHEFLMYVRIAKNIVNS
jgi:hypothetical protein